LAIFIVSGEVSSREVVESHLKRIDEVNNYADLDPQTGISLLLDTVKVITPGNVLGLPSVALPMGVVDKLPSVILIYADLWREDLCLEAAEII
jgi:Asp-tRNA(Asn)/Glu-tRNA(Gln) amidotransferase A subunit family amidase